MPCQEPRLDHVLADVACQSRQTGDMQVEGLARLDGELGAAAVPHGQAVRALRDEAHTVSGHKEHTQCIPVHDHTDTQNSSVRPHRRLVGGMWGLN